MKSYTTGSERCEHVKNGRGKLVRRSIVTGKKNNTKIWLCVRRILRSSVYSIIMIIVTSQTFTLTIGWRRFLFALSYIILSHALLASYLSLRINRLFIVLSHFVKEVYTIHSIIRYDNPLEKRRICSRTVSPALRREL